MRSAPGHPDSWGKPLRILTRVGENDNATRFIPSRGCSHSWRRGDFTRVTANWQ